MQRLELDWQEQNLISIDVYKRQAVSDPIDYDPNVTTIYLKELVAPKYHKLSSTVYTLKVSSRCV